MICYGVYNLQETKYGTAPTDQIFKYGMLHGFKRMCIAYESIVTMVRHFFSIYIDIYYLILQFSLFSPIYILSLQFIFNVCRWKLKKNKTIKTVKKTFLKITQVMEVARAVTTIQAKNDDHYVCISKQGIVFFEICL